jgi:hypothetical protein
MLVGETFKSLVIQAKTQYCAGMTLEGRLSVHLPVSGCSFLFALQFLIASLYYICRKNITSFRASILRPCPLIEDFSVVGISLVATSCWSNRARNRSTGHVSSKQQIDSM